MPRYLEGHLLGVHPFHVPRRRLARSASRLSTARSRSGTHSCFLEDHSLAQNHENGYTSQPDGVASLLC